MKKHLATLTALVFLFIPILSYGATSTTTTSQIGREDMNIYTGGVKTFNRRTSTGGTLSLNKLSVPPPGSVIYPEDWGAKGDGTTDDSGAIRAAKAACSSCTISLQNKTYAISTPLIFTSVTNLQGETGARIKAKAAMDYVIKLDGNSTLAGTNMHGSRFENIILDGGGYAKDGLYLRAVVSGVFNDIRVTNVTTACLHGAWVQVSEFRNFACSNNIETFTTTPTTGILLDGGVSSSANLFTNVAIEGVSGSGVKLISGINSVFIGGTSEGNDVGIECGDAGASGMYCLNNHFSNMDIEVNASGDYYIRSQGIANDFISISAGWNSGASRIVGGKSNYWSGGTIGSITFDNNTSYNSIYGTSINMVLGGSATLTDNGSYNHYSMLRNIIDGTLSAEKTYRRRDNHPLGAGDNATIHTDHSKTKYQVVTLTTGITAATIATPTNPLDGELLTFSIHNGSGNDVVTITWPSVFRGLGGWTCPKTTYSKTIQLIYDANYGFWFVVGPPNADQNGTYDL